MNSQHTQLQRIVNNPFYMKLLFISMFLIYGLIISTISFTMSNYFQTQNTKTKLIRTEKQSLVLKSHNLKERMNGFTNQLKSLNTSRIFQSYTNNFEMNDNVLDLFRTSIYSIDEISQLRFIDAQGNEKIRFDRKKLGGNPHVIKEDRLQNKFNRYYFQDVAQLKNGELWFSKIDLNMEHGIIVKPIIPTIRIGTPVFNDDKFIGIIIMNIFIKDIIHSFVSSPFFNISLLDKEGDFIHHRDHHDESITDYSWSKYLKTNYIKEEHQYQKLVQQSGLIEGLTYVQNISSIIPNIDGLTVVYEAKVLKVKEMADNERNYIVTVTFIVSLIAIPLAIIISLIPNSLNAELFDTKKRLEKELEIIDQYVYLSVTNRKGIILAVSEAYTHMTGFSKEELIGNKHNMLRHPHTPAELYNDMWSTICQNRIWEGELKNLKKDGTEFYIKLHISPDINAKGEIVSFTSYMQDISYEKEIERLSITDELTSLYNRREFNKVLTQSMGLSQRFKNPFAMMMLDIDHFKQYNDTYGHQSGDNALVLVANAINEQCQRVTDVGFRVGGEEFAIIFSAKSKEDAFAFAQTLRTDIENLQIKHEENSSSAYITISAGVFFQNHLIPCSEESIYNLTDKALYEAKMTGRNRVVLVD